MHLLVSAVLLLTCSADLRTLEELWVQSLCGTIGVSSLGSIEGVGSSLEGRLNLKPLIFSQCVFWFPIGPRPREAGSRSVLVVECE